MPPNTDRICGRDKSQHSVAEWPEGIKNCVSRLASFSSSNEAGETAEARGEERKDGNEPLIDPGGYVKTSLNFCPCSSSRLTTQCQQVPVVKSEMAPLMSLCGQSPNSAGDWIRPRVSVVTKEIGQRRRYSRLDPAQTLGNSYIGRRRRFNTVRTRDERQGLESSGGEQAEALTAQWVALCRYNLPASLDKWSMGFCHRSVACDVCRNRKRGELLRYVSVFAKASGGGEGYSLFLV